jgi:peptide/nickel transport system permease protein
MPHDPEAQNLALRRSPPGDGYLLGTDEFGRDILSRVILGTRVALLVAFLAVGIALVVGTTIGLVAGFVGGWLDEVLMRIMDVLLAFPYLLLAVAIVAALGPGVTNTTLAVGIWATPSFARIVRGQTLALRRREFVLAARALGASAPRLMWRHVLPNIVAPVIVFATLYMANAILLEAALSFLGLGVQPPQPSWGLMISSGRDFLRVAPHVATVPGLAIMLAVLAFNLLGDGLRDALDPRLRNQL